MIKKIVITIGSILLVAFVLSVSLDIGNVMGSAPSGLSARQSFTRQVDVGPNLVNDPIATTTGVRPVLFLDNPQCAARIISTLGSPIMLYFSSTTSGVRSTTTPPSMTYGHLQGASTTVAYDGGLYGCGNVQGFWNTTTTITVTETR